MLLSMQQLASTARPSQGGSFADLLAGLALPAKKLPQRDLDGLEDDVATLSYEQALRNRSVSSPSPAEMPLLHPIARSRATETPAIGSQPRARRSSSVTVRFSQSEAEQLHTRAAEAGLTVSAYLRSCAFEIESLRAEVKSTLAQLRSATQPPEAKPDTQQVDLQRRWLSPMFHLFRSRKQL
jgi:hypothetical protein